MDNKAPSLEGAFLVYPHLRTRMGVGYWDGGGGGGGISRVAGQAIPVAVGFFFGNTELSMELWTIMSGISGFDD